MTIITKKMKQWLKIFTVFFNILLILSGIECVSCTITFLMFACNKNLFSYKFNDQTTVSSLFEEIGIASRKELLVILSCIIIYSALSIAMFALLTKWFKKAYQTGNPFSEDLVQLLRKTAKYMIIASIIGFIVEALIQSIGNVETNNSTYATMFLGGLLAMCIYYVLAYASVKISQSNSANTIENFETLNNLSNPTSTHNTDGQKDEKADEKISETPDEKSHEQSNSQKDKADNSKE